MTGYVKVLVGNKSRHGDTIAWSLPVQNADGSWVPGEWHDRSNPLSQLDGYCLTNVPALFWADGAEADAAEFEEVLRELDGRPLVGYPNQIVCRRVRLLRKLTDAELKPLNVFRTGFHGIGSHDVAAVDGTAEVEACGQSKVIACGRARVTAYDSACVQASGNARVSAFESTTVTACDNVTVWASGNFHIKASEVLSVTARDCARVNVSGAVVATAYDSVELRALSATVKACDSSRVEALGGTVEAYDRARVIARGRSNVTAYDNTTVEAYDNAVVITQAEPDLRSPTVKVEDRAVHLNRSGTCVTFRTDGRAMVILQHRV